MAAVVVCGGDEVAGVFEALCRVGAGSKCCGDHRVESQFAIPLRVLGSRCDRGWAGAALAWWTSGQRERVPRDHLLGQAVHVGAARQPLYGEVHLVWMRGIGGEFAGSADGGAAVRQLKGG